MAGGTGVVYIAEEAEPGDDGWYLTGTFYGHLDADGRRDEFSGLSAQQAIAWGRRRAGTVLIRLGDSDYYSAGDEDARNVPPWPPPDLPPLVRRRPAHEAWKDRTPDDEPIAWRVTVTLAPPDATSPRAWATQRAQWDRIVADVAVRAGAESWDSEQLDGFIADLERPRNEAGWVSDHSSVFSVHFPAVSAPTHELAAEAARSRCRPPRGWKAYATAEPA